MARSKPKQKIIRGKKGRFQLAEVSNEVQVEEDKNQDTSAFDGGVRVQVKPIGASGTELQGGYFSEEYLHKLRGRRGAKVYDEMRRSEAQVSMILNAIMNPIKSAPWEVQQADEALVPDAKRHQEFIECCRTEMIDWEAHIHEALTLVPFGFSLFEVIHQAIFNHPKFGTVTGLKGLAFRSQKTIERWIVSDDTGNLEQVEQWVQGDLVKGGSANRLMDAQHLLVMSLNKEGDNYEGISALRPMYGAYFRKNLYLKILAMGIEQNAKGTVVGTIPASMDKDDDQVEEFKQILQNYVAHESAYIMKPAGWEVTIENHDFDPEKLKNVIVFENTEMINSLCANFLALGTNGGGGAFALADSLSDFMLIGIKCIANIVSGSWNRVLIPNLIKLNFGPQAAYPQLMVSGIEDKAGKDLAEIIKSFVDSGVIKADDKLEESLRKRYGLSKADTLTARDAAPANPGFGGAPAPEVDPAMTPAQFSERRIKLAEGNNKAWAANKSAVKDLMQAQLKTLLNNYTEQLKKDWANATPASKPGLALKLSPKGLSEYKNVLREQLAEIATEGLRQAKKQTPWLKDKKIKLSESIQLAAPKGGFYDALPPRIKRLIKANADLIAQTQNTDVARLVSFQYGSSVAQDNIDQIILDIDGSVLPVINGSTIKGTSIDAAAGNAVSQALQQARTEWFFEPEVLETIESFTYFNAEPISEICNELLGVTLAANDPLLDTYATPLHHNCDGEWIPNEKGANGNPDIKRGGVPITQRGLDSITLCECHGFGIVNEV